MKMVNTLKRLISIFAIFATSLPVLSYSATQSSYPTKGIPVAGDKALITDSADGNKTKQATVGSLPISTATQNALDGKETKAVVQASAPADTTVDWYDTDQESGVLVLKRHNGTTWVRASSHGVQYASNCAGITAGMCVDTDDGKLYYHNNTSVVEVGVNIDLSNYLSKTNTTAFSPTGDYHPATKKYVDDAVTAGGGYTDEQAQDAVGGMFADNTETGITVTYNDSTGKVDFVVATQSDVNFTSALNTKLAGIAAGAEVNVNADWNASSGDAQILNKPTIPTVSDTAYGASWNGDLGAASKNAIYDKIETIVGGSMTYPSSGIPISTGSAWGTSITPGTGIAEALASSVDGTGGLASKAALDALPNIVFGTGLTVTEDTPSVGSDTVSVTPNTYQAYDADWLGVTANGASLISAANYAAMRALLDLEVGTDFNAYDADLTTWAGVTPGAGIATFLSTPSGENLAQALTSALPASKGGTGLTSIGTGVSTALGNNTGVVGGFPTIIASGSYTVDTASISANTCASAVAVTASGVTTTDTVIATPNAILSSVAGFGVTTAGAVRIDIYPTSGNVNFQFCNPTGAAIDPGSVTFNWKVIR